jgi:hypothetical protein
MGIFLRKRSNEEGHVKLIAYTIILYISSLFVPFVIVASYQSMVYYSKSQWLFSTPSSAYITFMMGMLFIAIVFTAYLILRVRWDTRSLKWITGLFILLSVPFFIFSLTNYYYLDQKGIHYHSLTSIKEREYQWENVSTINIIYRNHNGTTGYYQYKFLMGNGSEVTIPYSDKLDENKWRMEEIIRKYNIKVKDNYKNPIVD